MKIKLCLLLLVGLAIASVSTAFAARAFWEDGFYLDEQGNVVGGSTVPCAGPEVFWGVRTSIFVVTGSGSCNF